MAQNNQLETIMGIYNMVILLFQIFIALVCSSIYAVNNALDGNDNIGWVLKMGGLAALMAVLLCKRFED